MPRTRWRDHGRLREDRGHDRREHGYRTDVPARPTLGVPLQAGLAKAYHHAGRGYGQFRSRHLYLAGHSEHPVVVSLGIFLARRSHCCRPDNNIQRQEKVICHNWV